MKNCFSCKHCKSFSLDIGEPKDLKDYNANPTAYVQLRSKSLLTTLRVGKCLLGHNDRMKSFRDEHGDKPSSVIEADRTLDMDCHEYHESTKILDSMIKSTDELIELLKNKK